MREYNVFNQLTSLYKDTVKTTYEYRPDGLRHRKSFSDGTSTTHVWDGSNMVAEYKDNLGISARYLRGLGLLGSDFGNGLQYYLLNAHGDVVEQTHTNGIENKHYEYDAFGAEDAISQGDSNPFRYCGEYYDSEAETIYLRARNYRPTTGRFTSEDPVRADLNWYVYCGNNPVMFVDPTGLVEVNLHEYAKTYDGMSVGTNRRGATTLWYDNKSYTVWTSATTIRNGISFVDDSVFINAFGNGKEALTVYQEGNSISIRTNVSFNKKSLHTSLETDFSNESYSREFINSVEEYWTGNFGKYEVSTYLQDITGSSKNHSIKVKFNNTSKVSNVQYGFGWSPKSPGKVNMYQGYSNNEIYSLDNYKWVSAHEFGHILGVTDAYSSKNSTGVTSIYNVFGTTVQEGDIAKVLEAWNSGKSQNWA